MTNPIATIRPADVNDGDVLGTLGAGGDWRQEYSGGFNSPMDEFSPVVISDLDDNSWLYNTNAGLTRIGYWMQTLALPALSFITQVRVNCRFNSGTGGSVDIETYLAQGASVTTPDHYTDNSIPAVAKTGAWATSAPDGGPWTVDKVNNCRVVLLNNGGGGVQPANWLEVSIDIEYNQAPTVAITGPLAGQTITDNNKPQIQWSYSDPESEAQTHYQVAILNDPQDPSSAPSSAIIYDTGDVTSASNSFTPPVALPDGNVWIYVRAHESNYGRWSAWAVEQVAINTLPGAVTIISPTYGQTITQTEQPTIQWSWWDPGGPGQDRFQVLIFQTAQSDPQGNAANAVASSGEILSGYGTWQVPDILDNGTYYVYVKAADTVAGTVRYSDWSTIVFYLNVAPAAVTITAPANNSVLTDNNKPTFSWIFESPLGLQEERWQVLVFTSGQNDPGASADSAVLNSGETFSTATSWTPTKGLSNGVYYGYVRAADVGSSGRYSSWKGVSFTVNTIPTAIPVLRVDPTPIDFPRAGHVPNVNVDVMVAENMFDADTANFETAVGSWLPNLNCTIARGSVTGFARNGTGYLFMSAIAAGQTQAYANYVSLTAGRYLSAGAWIKPTSSTRKTWLRIDWWNAASYLSTTNGPQYSERSGEWTQIEVTGIAPPGATRCLVVWMVEGCAAGEFHSLDTPYARLTPNKSAATAVDDANFVWPANLFGVPAFQDGLTPQSSLSPWNVYNDTSTDIAPLFWHSGDAAIPAVSAPAPVLVLNLAGLPAAAAAYGCRRLNGNYTGALVKVRRDSDGATMDIGFISSGDLDTQAILTFGKGSIVRLQELYDQSGNGLHLTETDPTHMFRISNGTSVYTVTVGSTTRPCLFAEDAVRGMVSAAFGSTYTGTKLSAVAVGLMTSSGAGATGKTSNVIDDFTTQNTAIWNGFNSSVVVSSGQLRITPTTSYYGVTTNAKADLTADNCVIQLVSRANGGAGSIETQFVINVSSGNQLAFIVSGTNLTMREKVGNVSSDTAVSYDAVNHQYLRFRESAGTVYWDTSPDGTTWTNRRNKTSTLTLTSVQIQLEAGYWGTETSVGTAVFDNLNTGSTGLTMPRIASAYGAGANDNNSAQGAVLISRDGNNAAVKVARNGTTYATRALSYGTLEFWDGVIDDATRYEAGVDGISTAAGSPPTIGALATTHFAVGHTGAAYQSVAGMRIAEVVFYENALTTAQLQIIQANASSYYGTAPVPVAGGSGSGGGGSSAYNPNFRQVASLDMTTDPMQQLTLYNFGKATSYLANSWMSRNVTWNAQGKYLDLRSWKNGSYREGGAGFWNLPAAIGKSMAWEIDYATDDVPWMSPVMLTWFNGSGVWPPDGEMDLAEIFNGGSKLSTVQSFMHLDTVANSTRALHFPTSASHSSSPDIARGSYGVNATQIHTWRIEWIAGVSIYVYCDGVLRGYTTDTSFVPHTLQHRLTFQQEQYGYADNLVAAGSEAHTRIYGLRAYTYTG